MHSTMMEPCVVWEFPSLPIGDSDCCDVIIEKPCIVGAQPTGDYTKIDTVTIASGIPWFNFHISLCRLKIHTSDNFLDIHNDGINPFIQSIVKCVHLEVFLHVGAWHGHALFNSPTIVKTSHVHSDVLSEEGGVDLELLRLISLWIIMLQKLHDLIATT